MEIEDTGELHYEYIGPRNSYVSVSSFVYWVQYSWFLYKDCHVLLLLILSFNLN
jgi:hypothetical protein